MARQRMYLFERAYRDYAAKFLRFLRSLQDQAASIWDWFWSGPGSDVIEQILRVTVVLSGVFLGNLYVNYEKDHGRGFSVSTFFAFLMIAGYVSVLMWGWKAPVHFAARALSGAVAAALVIVLGLLVILPAILVFSIYLGGLVGCSALSFVVFLPMRAGQQVWLFWRKLAYHCPNDDCRNKGLPIHICECGTKYPDLLPSFYGIFHHTCRHNGKQVKLPTLDLLGRSKLPRLCGGCQRPLIHSSIGELEVRPIALVGGTNTGKSVFLAQAIRCLHAEFGGSRGATVRIDSEDQENRYAEQSAILDRGQVLPKTAEVVSQAVGLALRVPERKLKCLLHLFDAAGEKFAAVPTFGQMQAIEHLKGIILLVDPFSMPLLEDQAPRVNPRLKPSQVPMATILDTLIAGVRLGRQQSGDRSDIPVAVVLSKADAFPIQEYPFLENLYARDGKPDAPDLEKRCRTALEKLGGRVGLQKLEQNFRRVGYFACTALGRMPEIQNTQPFQPAGVIEPLLWLLNAQGERLRSESARFRTLLHNE